MAAFYLEINSLQELEIFARFLANSISKHEVIFCRGDLGSGKTSLAKSFFKEMGVKENITSPTFNLHLQYESKLGLCSHYDLYRLKNLDDAIEIGIFDDENICFIEWPEIIQEEFKDPDFLITITILENNLRALQIQTNKWLDNEYKLSDRLTIKKL